MVLPMATMNWDGLLAAKLRDLTMSHRLDASQIALAIRLPLDSMEQKWHGASPLEFDELDRWCHFLDIESTSLWLEVANEILADD